MTGELKVYGKPARMSRHLGPQVRLCKLVAVEVSICIAQKQKSLVPLGQLWGHRIPGKATRMNICAFLPNVLLSAMTVFIIPESQLKRMDVALARLLRFDAVKLIGCVQKG